MVKLLITDTDGKLHEIKGEIGTSLMNAAVDAGLDIRAECGGALACATCHMVIDPKWVDLIPAKSADEEDMLDFADGVKPNSRLTCQIEISADMEGLVATIAPPMV